MNIIDKINEYSIFAPEYDGMLSNHLPMAMYALFVLGASENEIDKFIEDYFKETKLLRIQRENQIKLDEKNWKSFLGKRKYFPNFCDFFSREIDRLDQETFINLYFNQLIRGLSAAAYHAILRLAYGVASSNKSEIVHGMSYLADAYLELKADLPVIKENGLSLFEQAEIISNAMRDGLIMLPKLEGVIFEKMFQISQPEVFKPIQDYISLPQKITLSELSKLGLMLYLSTKNFTALHTVTSAHAMRILYPYIDDKFLALQLLYQAFCAAYISIGAPPIERLDLEEVESLNIDELKRGVYISSDDHLAKITYALLEEHSAYQDRLYLKAL